MADLSLLTDNRQPTEQEWRDACRLGQTIISAVEERETVIERMGLDRAFCLPAANWAPDAPNPYMDAYRVLRTLKWDEVRHLRLLCQPFTGFNLLHMRAGEAFDYSLPEDMRLDSEPPLGTLQQWRTLTSGLAAERIFRPPCALGEIGWRIDGAIVNYETCVCQERVTLLHLSGVLDWLKSLGRPPRILEIGAGYGALSFALSSCFPTCTYTICDLPESLLFSGLYLKLAGRRRVVMIGDDLGPDVVAGAIELIPNYLFGRLAASQRSYDLAINVLSMSEMSEFQVETYGRGLKRLLGSSGLFFEQNHDNTHLNMIYAANVLARIFPYCQNVDSDSLRITQGPARVWANNKTFLARPPSVERTQRLEALEATVEESSGRLLAVERVLDEGHGRLVSLERALDEIHGRLVSLERALDERHGRLVSLERALDERHGRLVSLERALDERDRRIESLEAGLAENNERLKASEAAASRHRLWARIGSTLGRWKQLR